MAQNSAITQQITDYYNQTLSDLQGQLAQRNQQWQTAGQWGGSQSDIDMWKQWANNTQGQINTLKQNYGTLLDAQQKYDIGGDILNQGTISKYLSGDPTTVQGLNEYAASQGQLATQNQKLSDLRNNIETQEFGGTGLSLNQALTSTGGDIGNYNQFLGQQEAQTFNTQLKPLIQMALGAQGLSDSGANVELQSKALAGLQQSREQTMMGAALGARSQIQGLQRSDVLGDIGTQQQMQSNLFDIQRTGLTMQFQQQLENQREQLALQLAQRQGGGGGLAGGIMGGLQGGLAGAAQGFMLGGPYGAIAGGAMGAGAGAYSGSQGYGGGGGMGQSAGMLGGSFFANNNSNSGYQINNPNYNPQAGWYAPGYQTYQSMGPHWNG